MMHTTDWRSRRYQTMGPNHFSIANYYTEARKTEINGFGEDIFHGLHLIPEPLKKNLADTLVTNQPSKDYQTKPEASMPADYSPLSGIASFFSGMLNALSGAVFKRARSPSGVDDVAWQQANPEDKNGLNGTVEANVAMTECKTAAAACEDKLNQVRQLLSNKTTRYQPRKPRRAFGEPAYVEEHFEDAFSPEDCVTLASDRIIEYFSPLQYQQQEFSEVDAAKMRVEVAPLFNHDNLLPEVVNVDSVKEEVKVESPQVVASCEDKLSKLKVLLQNKKDTMAKKVESTPVEVTVATKPTKSIPINKTKDKRFKNPHRLSTEKRQKSKMKQTIEEDLLFANEINLDEASSFEDSPSFHIEEKEPETPSYDTPQEFFDEISGRFRTASASSEDSFQIVFQDIPKRSRSSSECDSEDSFIVFEDSPDSCYTSNDVFGDSDSECSDCVSDISDSDCEMRLTQSLSRTVSNLTDDSLYDEVDCARTLSDMCDSETNTGLLLDDRKKALRKNLPAKKVRFSEAPPRVVVMRVWAFAARQARIGNWQQCIVDRNRFKRRIADVDMALSWVLNPQHRARIMFQRFMPWWNAQKRQELADKKQKEEEERVKREAVEDVQTGNDNTAEINTQNRTDNITEVSKSGEVAKSFGSDAENTQNVLNKNNSSVPNFNCAEENLVNGNNDEEKCSQTNSLGLQNGDSGSNADQLTVNGDVLNCEVLKSKLCDAKMNVIYNDMDVKACESPTSKLKFEIRM